MQEYILDEDLLEEEEDNVLPWSPHPSGTARLMAFFVDVWFVGMVFVTLFFIGLYFELPASVLFPFVMLVPLYKWLAEGYWGATVGKYFFEMSVVKEHSEEAITLGDSLKRNGVLFPFFVLVLVWLYVKAMQQPLMYDIELEMVFDTYNRMANVLFILIAFYGVGYILGGLTLLLDTPARSIYDKFAKTICVNLPVKEVF